MNKSQHTESFKNDQSRSLFHTITEQTIAHFKVEKDQFQPIKDLICFVNSKAKSHRYDVGRWLPWEGVPGIVHDAIKIIWLPKRVDLPWLHLQKVILLAWEPCNEQIEHTHKNTHMHTLLHTCRDGSIRRFSFITQQQNECNIISFTTACAPVF